VTRTLQGSDLDSVRPLTSHEFEQFRQLAYRTFGLDLKPGKEELVSARLRRLVCSGGFRRFQDYYGSVVQDRTGEQLRAMIDALATNHTSFLREPDHFRYLCDQVIPSMRERKPVEVWCAACSTGEEVWSLAIMLAEEGLLDRTILYATDINPEALKTAEAGVYDIARVAGFSRAYLEAGGKRSLADYYTAGAHGVIFDRALRRNTVFADHSLATDSVFSEVHLVSCRNVLIYFDRELQERALGLFHEALIHRGFLGLGSRETLRFSSHARQFAEFCAAERIYQRL